MCDGGQTHTPHTRSGTERKNQILKREVVRPGKYRRSWRVASRRLKTGVDLSGREAYIYIHIHVCVYPNHWESSGCFNSETPVWPIQLNKSP